MHRGILLPLRRHNGQSLKPRQGPRPHRDGHDLTRPGKSYWYQRSAEAQNRVFERTAREQDGDLAGPVRIDVPEPLGQQVLLPGLADLLENHPNIRIEMHSSVHPRRPIGEEADIAPAPEPDLNGQLPGLRLRTITTAQSSYACEPYRTVRFLRALRWMAADATSVLGSRRASVALNRNEPSTRN
ncbi:hypothetical protein GHK48_26355 [Sinorhizobium fredii]|uniref:LysR substrate-binding domain-containing protein n=1 Tax=Rhizobium fredii TaxID=380 RepID=A0A844AHU9_RHIFR|nr:hypothetical protein [Sinorhizobium fredii]MQX11682.1 hypothetical protein [Sinorhizobium fredii]UTY45468.1 hypothetical protein EPK84_00325 [Sinorhizobium fredii]